MGTTKETLNSFCSAYDPSFPYHDENHIMLTDYSQRLCETCLAQGTKNILSFGIGHGIVAKTIITKLGAQLQNYVIIEGSQEIISRFKDTIDCGDKVEIHWSLFEEFPVTRPFSAIEMGFVLEHIDHPQALLERVKAVMKSESILHIAVPNARSLHRLIGHHADLLPDLYSLSEHDLKLGHQRYFDLDIITGLLHATGYEIVATEGIFLKPVTTNQLNQLRLSREIFSALSTIATDLPAISNAIYIEAKLA